MEPDEGAPRTLDEPVALSSRLDLQRARVSAGCAGLTDRDARRAPVRSAPLLTVAGLVARLTDAEQWWFEAVLHDGPDLSRLAGDDPDADWVPPRGATLDRLLARYDARCARSRRLTAGLGLSFLARREPEDTTEPCTLRWIMLHMIERTARYTGRLDVLRMLLDDARPAERPGGRP